MSRRQDAYKAKGAFKQDELRRRREEAQVEIRRQKREESMAKRRNLVDNLSDGADSDDDETQGAAIDAQLTEQLPSMIEGVMGEDLDRQLDCTTKFRKLLSKEKNPPIEKVIACGVVPRFVEFLRSPHSMIQVSFERIAWHQNEPLSHGNVFSLRLPGP